MTLRSHWRMTPRALRSAPFNAEQLDHLGLTLRGRPHQGRLPTEILFRVHEHRFQQPLRRIDLAGAGDGHQWRLALRILEVSISTPP